MCNFVIRPIKSYVTLDIVKEYQGDKTVELERGQEVQVISMLNKSVLVEATNKDNEKYEVRVPLDIFVHAFTANPADVEAAKKEEQKLFKK